MLRNIFRKLLERRHYWRTVGFSQLAELYANRMMRLLAVNMVSGITGVYMYQLGYPLWGILMFFTIYFIVRMCAALTSAYFVGWVGPRQAILISSVMYIAGLVALTQLSTQGLWALGVYTLTVGTAVSVYTVSYHVGFSKIKTSEHAGREIGLMHIVEKIGAGLSPVIGGFAAFLFGPETTIWAASIILVLSAIPLFFSPDPVMTNQRIILRGFNWRATRRQLLASVAVGLDQVMSVGVWSLFVAVGILGTTNNVVYAQLGGLTTVAFVGSILFSRLYGAIVDKRKGGTLLKAAVLGDSLLHLSRPFVATPFGVVFVNIANEAVTSGYSMPYLKGMYDMADDLPGYRIVYMSLMDAALSLGAALFSLLLVCLTYFLHPIQGMQIGYVAAAVMVLPILFHGFPALKKPRFYRS